MGDLQLETPDSNLKSKDGVSCIKMRYILIFMCASSLALNYIVNVCMSVAIVAMVKPAVHLQTFSANLTDADVCPITNMELNPNNATQEGEFEWDEELQGYILASYYYGYVSTQVLGGRLAENFGGKHVVGSGIMMSGLLILLAPTCAWTHVYLLMALRVLQGAVGGIMLPAVHVLFPKWIPPEERPHISGLVFSAIHIGSVLAMSVTGLLVDASGWPTVFYFFGAVAIAWFIPWMIIVYETPEEHPRISYEEKTYLMKSCGSTDKKKVAQPVPWRSILTSAPVWAYMWMNFAITWEIYTFLSELPNYSKNVLHFNIRESGLISALPYLFDWMSSICSGFVSRWLQSRGHMSKLTTYKFFNGLVAGGGALCLYAITVVGCDATLITVLFVVTLTTHGLYVAGSNINHMDLAVNFSGTIAGLSFTLCNLAGILAPSVAGIIINEQQTLTRWNQVFYIAIAVLVIPYIFYLFCGSAEEQSWNRPQEQPRTEDNGRDAGRTNPAFSQESEDNII
ncbi:putative inorganic phosphate cotransporter [Periplaneta americana]|uniref:putative inorganic phosphate cotransporter n=1 Tax=Periplaneta americana TaxID=6978 RepID=UPI0037E8B017